MAAAEKDRPTEIRFSGAANNLNNPLDLYLRKQNEVASMVNADLSYPGKLKLLRPLLARNAAAVSNIHSLCVADGVAYLVAGRGLKYLSGTTLTALYTLSVSLGLSWTQVGDWLFIGNGTDKLTIYLPTPVACQWGLDIPTVAPTVVDSTTASTDATPFGIYDCYYRYRVTLPDGTLILTALSPLASVDVTTTGGAKISWTVPAAPSFVGATSVQIDLFRTSTSLPGVFLVTTLAVGATTYTDDLSDAALQLLTAYAEIGYYPPPDHPEIVFYYPAADRLFCTVAGDAYWSAPGMYHIFIYSADVNEYTNVNSVFLGSEHILAVQKIDENLYFGSAKTWRRLRGRSPANWSWEDTGAIIGPINQNGCCETPWGVLHPAIDGKMWLFNGINSKPILEEFVFTTPPDATCHATFDGRFYRLFYGDTSYPSLVVDFMKYPSQSPRIVQSTQDMTASFYDKLAGELWLADAQYVRSGEDTGTDVTLSFRLPNIPMVDLTQFGSMGQFIIRVNTGGDDLTITPYFDDVAAADPLNAINNNALQYEEVPICFGEGRTMSFEISITSHADVTIQEPWVLTKE